MQKLKRICVLLISAILILGCSFNSYARINHLMFATDSNAVAMFSIPKSSISSLDSTVVADKLPVRITFTSISTGVSINRWVDAVFDGERFVISRNDAPSGYVFTGFNFQLMKENLPAPGGYLFSFEYSSDFAMTYSNPNLWYSKVYENADRDYGSLPLSSYFSQLSGDFSVAGYDFNLSNVDYLILATNTPVKDNVTTVAGSFAVAFHRVEVSDEAPSTGKDTSQNDYQFDVSSSLSNVNSSLSNISSSMADNAESIEEVADAIDALRGAMEPHYDNVLTQLHHVTEQLHALWDQQYNLHHVPLMAKLGDIITAIETMDVNITVDVDGLKSTINTMSTNIQNKLGSVQTALTNKLTSVQTAINDKLTSVQNGINNKLQSITDTITGGYDNTGIKNENSELSGAVDGLDQAEKEVLDDVTGYIEEFEYPTFSSFSSGLLGAIAFFGGFLQSVFLAMGDFGLIITFSLTMIFVLIIVGYHRIRT